MIGQADCFVRAFRSPASSQDPCSTVQLPFGDYDNETLDVLETMVACENFSYAHGLCVDEFSKLNPTEASDGLAVRCILEAAKRPEFAGNRDAQTCLKFGGGNDGLLQSAAVKVGCTSWCCPGLCPGRRRLVADPDDNDDKIPFIPMLAAADAPSDPTCLDVLEWCQDPRNFMTRNCPHDPTTEDFDPAECQNLYTMIGQGDCIVRAFRSTTSSQDPCSTVQLPFGDYDNETLDVLEMTVACENFSYAHMLCVDEFSKLDPTKADSDRAMNCILAAAKLPEFAGDDDAQACLRIRQEPARKA